ncbi:MAG: hypothetical protein IKZ46_13840 [Victivallales bacterium]|nr:hypothetical protein [Victivallales bacterium]
MEIRFNPTAGRRRYHCRRDAVVTIAGGTPSLPLQAGRRRYHCRRDADGTSCAQRRDAVVTIAGGTPMGLLAPNGETPMGPPAPNGETPMGPPAPNGETPSLLYSSLMRMLFRSTAFLRRRKPIAPFCLCLAAFG